MDSATAADFAVCCPSGSLLEAELRKRGILCFPWIEADLHLKSRWRRFASAVAILIACCVFVADIIHLNQTGGYRITRVAGYLKRIPIVAHVRLFEDAAYLASCNPSSATLRGIIAVSDAIRSELIRFSVLSNIPIHRIYDAYVPKYSSVHPADALAVSRIVCVGRIEKNKGHEILVEAARILRQEITIVGDGELNFVEHVKGIAPSYVSFTGFKHDIKDVLMSCSVLACPSSLESFGRVILEAWDAGLVPVAFAGSGGAAEIISASGGGILYSEQTASSLAEALRTAIKLEPERRHLLVSKGRKWMLRETSPVVAGERIGEVLRSAVR